MIYGIVVKMVHPDWVRMITLVIGGGNMFSLLRNYYCITVNIV